MTEQNYYTFLKVSKLRNSGMSLEQALTYTVGEAIKKEVDNYGIVVLFFDKLEDIMEMPTHDSVYFLGNKELVDGKEIELCSGMKDFRIDKVITHSVDWTEKLRVGTHDRMAFVYLKDDEFVDEYKMHLLNDIGEIK